MNSVTRLTNGVRGTDVDHDAGAEDELPVGARSYVVVVATL